MKEYQHIGQTSHPDTGEWCLQVFSDGADRALVHVDPSYALILAQDLIEHAKRHMVPQ